jgi:hypothetical protein
MELPGNPSIYEDNVHVRFQFNKPDSKGIASLNSSGTLGKHTRLRTLRDRKCPVIMSMAYWAVMQDLHARRRRENRILVTGFAPQVWIVGIMFSD